MKLQQINREEAITSSVYHWGTCREVYDYKVLNKVDLNISIEKRLYSEVVCKVEF